MTIARAKSLLSGEEIMVDFPEEAKDLDTMIHEAIYMPDLLGRVVKAMGVAEMSVEDIHTMLIEAGLDEYQAYLTFIGGKMLYESKL